MNDIEKDNHIADFVDGKSASSTDLDLLQLEETILRLKRELPNKSIDAAASKQMLVRLKARMKREEASVQEPFWKKLFNFQITPQVGVIAVIAAVLVFAVISIPAWQTDNNETVIGTANEANPILIIGGIILILLGIYIRWRRK